MVAAGLVSGAYGFSLGRAALKGIRQPDSRPMVRTGKPQGVGTSKGSASVLAKEQDIIAQAKAYMAGNQPATTQVARKPEATAKPEAVAASPSPKAQPVANSLPGSSNQPFTSSGQFPLQTRDRGVTLAVRSARQEGDVVLLDVTLQNQGDRSVQFLYSFLDVADDRGRPLSASTSGLPSELPPSSQPVSGTVRIPAVLLEDSSRLSLTLTDYPNQQLQLQLSDIPISR